MVLLGSERQAPDICVLKFGQGVTANLVLNFTFVEDKGLTATLATALVPSDGLRQSALLFFFSSMSPGAREHCDFKASWKLSFNYLIGNESTTFH